MSVRARWKQRAAMMADDAWKWWDSLQPKHRNGVKTSGDRATIASLKRAGNILESMSEPASAELYRRLGLTRPDIDLPRAALVAAVLAHVREDARSMPFAEAIGRPRGGKDSQQLVTPLRFRRLIAAREPDDLLIAFRRAVAILGDAAPVKDLAFQLLAFTDPDPRIADIARTHFAFAYHGAAGSAPDADSDATTPISAEA